MKFITIGIVDYNVGNLTSVEKVLYKLGHRSRVSNNIKTLQNTDLLILPGVGAFPYAIESLKEKGLFDFILDWARKGKPVIGICLGMQILSDTSTEVKKSSGLSLIPGNVKKIKEGFWHIGWNSINSRKKDQILKKFNDGSLYFNHSYYFKTDPKFITSTFSLGPNSKKYTASIKKDNIVGLQFHPEKSQIIGKELLNLIVLDLYSA